MTDKERIQICQVCTNRKMNRNVGLVCGLTDKKPDFEDTCVDFDSDATEADYILRRKLAASGDDTVGDKYNFKKNKEIGLIIGCAGLFITIISHMYLSSIGFSIITYGAIIIGFAQYFKGVQQEKVFLEHKKKQDELTNPNNGYK